MECRWRGLRSRLADTIQRSIAIDPDAVRASAGMALSNATGLTSTGADDGETTAIIMSLRQKLKAQTDEVVAMQSKLSAMVNEHKQEVRSASHMLFRTVWLIMSAERDAYWRGPIIIRTSCDPHHFPSDL